MKGVDICAPMSPLNFFEKNPSGVSLLRSYLRLLTSDWHISSHFWVTSCTFSSYFHSKSSMFHCTNMLYFTKYSLQAPALACGGFHLACNSFSLVVERSSMCVFLCVWFFFTSKNGFLVGFLVVLVIVEAPMPRSRMHHTSISYIYKVFEHLGMLWMGVWVHPYADTSVQGGGRFLENWGTI